MNLFKSSEIIDVGIEKEKKRRDFYGLVSEKFKDPQLKDLFKKLRDWEEAHVQKFTEIKSTLEDFKMKESYDGELQNYMDSLVDEKLYNDVTPDNFSRNVKGPVDAINYGISFEKDAILFFMEFQPYLKDANKDIIQKLINEEKKHLIYLTELRKKYNAQ
ncbi:MAG: ferritin family protein [Spirochaetes bacterium]|nr:ferritin family protein [Spirochaetota bacterium]